MRSSAPLSHHPQRAAASLGVALLLVAGHAHAATTTSLSTLADWSVYGTASASGGTLTFGDTIGYDSGDTDRDGNPSNVWNEGSASGGQGLDYDWQVANKDFQRPFSVEWSGCLPTTRYGYNWFSLGPRNSTFINGKRGAGPMTPSVYFMSSWEAQGKLSVQTGDMSAPYYIPNVTASSQGICGTFKIDWSDADLLTFSFNGQQVYQRSYPAYPGQKMTLAFRSFEKAFSVTSVTVTESAAATPQPAAKFASSRVDFGAIKLGSSSEQAITLSNPGKAALPLSPATLTVSGDYAYRSDCGSSLAAGQSCTLTVAFAPQQSGSRSGTLSVLDGSGSTLASVTLTGSGSAGQEFVGSFTSQINAQVTDSSGQSKPTTCSASTGLQANDAGNTLSATATGTVVCADGVLINFTSTFDPVTQKLSGSYSDNLGNSQQPLVFTPTGAALTWTTVVQGTASKGQVRAYRADVTVTLPPQAIYAGRRPAGTHFGGPIKATNPVTIPLNIPQIGINQTLNFNVIVDGNWEADLIPGGSGTALTGKVSGTFKGDQEFHLKGQVDISSYIPKGVPLPPGFQTVIDVPIDIVINESFSGTLFGDVAKNDLAFKGFFTSAGQNVSLEMLLPFDANGNLPGNLNLQLGGNYAQAISPPTLPAGIPAGFLPDVSQFVPSSTSLPTTLNTGQIPFLLSP